MTTSSLQKNQPASLATCVSSDTWRTEVSKVIPPSIALDAMLRVARSVAMDSKFSQCDPKSFLLALLKCGRAGLYPDGREAHLIAFGKDVQCVFDWKGLVALASRCGYVVTPKLVHENDEFSVDEDDGSGTTRVVHRVDYRRPRGEVQAVYSRVLRPDGRVDYEIMTADEVEAVRQRYSRAKDSSPWKDSYGEMMKKTVIKRHSKRWDLSPEIRAAINSDDDSVVAHEAQPKISAPIFKKAAPVVTVDEPTPTEAPKPAEQPELSMNHLKAVRGLCKKDKISESMLIEFLGAIGLVQEETKLEDVPESALQMAVEQWSDFVQRMREVEPENA